MKRTSGMRRIAAAVLAAAMTAALAATAAATVSYNGPAVRDLEIRTYRDIPYRASFLAADGQGEDLTYTVVKQPRRGTVTIEGTEFIYTPKEGKTGRDSFTYTAADSAGNVSGEAKVTVVITKPKSGVKYEDMDGNPAAAAAQQMAEDGVFVGTCIGDAYYFEPERTVTRSEFLAMTMETAGISAPAVTMTGFCDDAAIPVWAKAYAASGLSGGLVQGRATADGIAFRGDEPVTWNQAAAILDRALSVADVDLAVWYADREAVPSWAAQAVANMESVCVLSAGSFGSGSMGENVTRADAARMLCNAAVLLSGEEHTLLSWLA